MKTLVLGGVRSGKSRLAERLARDCGLPVTYIATAQAGDDEMRERIAAHRARRSADWAVIEEPLRLASTLAQVCDPQRCVLVECLTLWLTNLLCQADPALLEQELNRLQAMVPALPGRLVFVGNEVNLGVIPADALTRRYCDLAGTLHQELAARCEQVVLTVAGLPLVIKGAPL